MSRRRYNHTLYVDEPLYDYVMRNTKFGIEVEHVREVLNKINQKAMKH